MIYQIKAKGIDDFGSINLDFGKSITGETLSHICFLGPYGEPSKLLQLLCSIIKNIPWCNLKDVDFLAVKWGSARFSIWTLCSKYIPGVYLLDEQLSFLNEWYEDLSEDPALLDEKLLLHPYRQYLRPHAFFKEIADFSCYNMNDLMENIWVKQSFSLAFPSKEKDINFCNKILDAFGLTLEIKLSSNRQICVYDRSSKQFINGTLAGNGIAQHCQRLFNLAHYFISARGQRCFLILDEPDVHIPPAMQFPILAQYDQVISFCKEAEVERQIFFTTHSPIVAAQVAPEERRILSRDEMGCLIAKNGIAPIGCTPHTILTQDFGLFHLLNEEGTRQWNTYLALRRQLREEGDLQKKDELMHKILEIGKAYDFVG